MATGVSKHYVIGSGISGIMTALRMQREGFDVVVVSNTPDPRYGELSEVSVPKGADSQKLTADTFNRRVMVDHTDGATLGGSATRMWTGTEGDAYLGQDNIIYPNMLEMLYRPVYEGGWLDRPSDALTDEEHRWIAKRALYDAEEHYVKDLRAFYFAANTYGMDGWDALKKEQPHLFLGADQRDGVIRSYDEKAKLDAAIAKYANAGQLEGVRHGEDILTEFPYLKSDKTAGVIKFRGGSVNIQQFVVNALQHLEENGADLRFDTELTDLGVNAEGVVERLYFSLPDGDEHIINNPQGVSLHLGAYDRNGVLKKTPAAGRVMGVAGLWMKMPRPEGMENAMKVHVGASKDGKYPLVDLNLIPCGNHLIVGGGYIFTGEKPTEISEQAKRATYESMMHGLRTIIADFDESSVEVLQGKQCSRSFTYDELPLLGRMPTSGGGNLVIAGGDNTGTTSMAPAMADLIRDYVMALHPRTAPSIELMARHVRLKNKSDKILDRGGSAPPAPSDTPVVQIGGSTPAPI
jgi:glycine/D-amino acid oxidase-like deaminating enzyme